MTLQELGWEEVTHNEEDKIFEFKNENRYIEIDKNYIDINIYKNGVEYGGWLNFDELEALENFIKTQQERSE